MYDMCICICIYVYIYIYIYIYICTHTLNDVRASIIPLWSIRFLAVHRSVLWVCIDTYRWIRLSFALPAHVTFRTLPYCLHSSCPCDQSNVWCTNVCGFMNAHVSHIQTLFAGGAGYSCGHCDRLIVVTVIILIFSHFTFITHPFVFQMFQWPQHPFINEFFFLHSGSTGNSDGRTLDSESVRPSIYRYFTCANVWWNLQTCVSVALSRLCVCLDKSNKPIVYIRRGGKGALNSNQTTLTLIFFGTLLPSAMPGVFGWRARCSHKSIFKKKRFQPPLAHPYVG